MACKAAGCGAEKSYVRVNVSLRAVEAQPLSLIQLIESQPQNRLLKYLVLFMKNKWLLVIIIASFHVEFKELIEKESAFNLIFLIILCKVG
jgi:hypothetical protein